MLYLKDGHKPLTAAVFDLGNTLLDYEPKRIMFELGIPQERIPRMLEIITDRPEWDEYDRGTLTSKDIEALAIKDEPAWAPQIRHYLKHWPEHFPAITENVETFYRIKDADVKVYILSNYMQDAYEYMARHNSFIDDFDGAIVSYQYQLNKPDPAIFKKLFDTYRIDPSTTVYFDDLPHNQRAGRAAGLLVPDFPKNGIIADFLEFEA